MEQQVWSIQLARQSTLRPRVAATTKFGGMCLSPPRGLDYTLMRRRMITRLSSTTIRFTTKVVYQLR